MSQARPKSKKAQKTQDNHRFDSRNAFFVQKWTIDRRWACMVQASSDTQVEGWIVSASPTGPFGAPPASRQEDGWSI